MIKFEKLPPMAPEDVNLTDEFVRAQLTVLNQPGENRYVRHMQYGTTIGMVILSNCGEDRDQPLLNGIRDHLVRQLLHQILNHLKLA